MRFSRIVFFSICFIGLAYFSGNAQNNVQKKKPNIIIIYVDDLGYGDLGSFGHPTIKTPHIDQMADEGIRLTSFYVGASICTPSRAALLTGRLPVRSGMSGSKNSGNVLYPRSTGGLPQSEITIAEALKTSVYKTGIIGKWHLGHLPEFLPLEHGFDYFFGIPYSNDMLPPRYKKAPKLPLYENKKVIESDPDQRLLTKRYTEKAINFIKDNKEKPFFLYYANNFPHTPLHASSDFIDNSKRGLYGDVVEEIDWSVGEIIKTLKALKIDDNTMVIFTSDNGPWLKRKRNGGSAGLLYEGKGSAYEGGFRVPAIAWWPKTIPTNQTSAAIVTAMDLYPTILNLAGSNIPQDRVLDGEDIYPLLTGRKGSVGNVVYYYMRDEIYAIRKGDWKAHFITRPSYSKEAPVKHNPPILYNVNHDPSEKYKIKGHEAVVKEILDLYKKHKEGVKPAFSQLDLGY